VTTELTRGLRKRLRELHDPVLVSRRLAFTLPNRARVPEVVRLMTDPTIARWTLMIPFPYRGADARAWIRRAPTRRRAGTDLSLHVVRRADGALVGGVGLHHLDAVHARGELGYWIGRPFRRQGYAREAARAVTAFGFHQLGLHRVEARVFPGNTASAGVLRASGFRREARLRESIVKQGRFVNEVVFAKLSARRTPVRFAPPASGAPLRTARRRRRSRPTVRKAR